MKILFAILGCIALALGIVGIFLPLLVLGSLVGAALGMDTTGVDFAMTALFLVIAVGQWKAAGSHLPVLLGAAATIASLMLVGADEMLLPALAVIVLGLTMLRPRLDDAFPKPGKKQEVRV